MLINGLGLGMVLQEILKKPEVTSVTVVELSEDVAKLVWPTYSADPRVTLVMGSAFDYQPPEGKVFDAVWHDIWPDISAANLSQMSALTEKYKGIAKWQGCWSHRECLLAKERTEEFRQLRRRLLENHEPGL